MLLVARPVDVQVKVVVAAAPLDCYDYRAYVCLPEGGASGQADGEVEVVADQVERVEAGWALVGEGYGTGRVELARPARACGGVRDSSTRGGRSPAAGDEQCAGAQEYSG